MDEGASDRFKGVLTRARLTYTEARLLEFLCESDMEPQKARDGIAALAKRFKVDVRPSQIEAFIWTQAQRVTKGQVVVQ